MRASRVVIATRQTFEDGFKCPVCSKSVASNEMEVHFIMCLSKPRLSYNDDVLARDAGECVICLEELQQGDTIARLPCLCIYHKRCYATVMLLSCDTRDKLQSNIQGSSVRQGSNTGSQQGQYKREGAD
ncbi:unnamed protein product, partial [Menidia menidia]